MIRKFFKTITKVLDGISGITKNIIFSIWRLVRGETLIFVCFYGWVVCPAGVCGPAWHVRSVHSPYINRFLTGRLPTRKNTQKSKFLLSQAFKWKKIMFFVIPEMPSKTFVMLYKKLPDHFKLYGNSEKGAHVTVIRSTIYLHLIWTCYWPQSHLKLLCINFCTITLLFINLIIALSLVHYIINLMYPLA